MLLNDQLIRPRASDPSLCLGMARPNRGRAWSPVESTYFSHSTIRKPWKHIDYIYYEIPNN